MLGENVWTSKESKQIPTNVKKKIMFSAFNDVDRLSYINQLTLMWVPAF